MRSYKKMIIDGHVHFWMLQRQDQIDCASRFAGINRDFCPSDLRLVTESFGVSGVVLIQAAPSTAETDFLLDLASKDEFIKAVVGWVDLTRYDVHKQLEQFSKQSKFSGVRAWVVPEPIGWLDALPVRQNIKYLVKNNLTLDLWIRPDQLPECFRLFNDFKELKAAINHCGRPLVVCKEWDPWAYWISKIGENSKNVVCKLSGLIERGGFDWITADLRPYVDHIFAAFGPDRTMYASNWPMINLVGNYSLWLQAINDILSCYRMTEEDKNAFFFKTAKRFYRTM